ncbi:MAG TPA: hypothetical protein VGQ35_07020 [Dongiaceae bacterium]|jgi:hypothetical protein|nr:hypothetical protein [Dongiaceae bacterium]
MVREFLAQIEPLRLTGSPPATPAGWRRWSWLVAGLAAVAIVYVTEHVLDLPQVGSFVSATLGCLFVAWLAYMALAGELGDETTR